MEHGEKKKEWKGTAVGSGNPGSCAAHGALGSPLILSACKGVWNDGKTPASKCGHPTCMDPIEEIPPSQVTPRLQCGDGVDKFGVTCLTQNRRGPDTKERLEQLLKQYLGFIRPPRDRSADLSGYPHPLFLTVMFSVFLKNVLKVIR